MIPDSLWRKFRIKLIEDKGGRQGNDVLKSLIEKYVEGEVKV